MIVMHATDALVTVACSVIAVQMARELIKRRADLTCNVSVVYHLVGAGFGLPTIRQLRARATASAKAINARRRIN